MRLRGICFSGICFLLAIDVLQPVSLARELQSRWITIRDRIDAHEDFDRLFGSTLQQFELATCDACVIRFCVLREFLQQELRRLVDLFQSRVVARLTVQRHRRTDRERSSGRSFCVGRIVFGERQRRRICLRSLADIKLRVGQPETSSEDSVFVFDVGAQLDCLRVSLLRLHPIGLRFCGSRRFAGRFGCRITDGNCFVKASQLLVPTSLKTL